MFTQFYLVKYLFVDRKIGNPRITEYSVDSLFILAKYYH